MGFINLLQDRIQGVGVNRCQGQEGDPNPLYVGWGDTVGHKMLGHLFCPTVLAFQYSLLGLMTTL